MKQNIEIEIPDGYEIENIGHAQVHAKHNPTQLVTVQLKKKQTKDFDFYVDEYLRSDCNTTNDMLCNWFEESFLQVIKERIKADQLHLVPWEVKIGLLKFIYNDIYPHSNESFDEFPIKTIVEHARTRQVCPSEFLSSFKL